MIKSLLSKILELKGKSQLKSHEIRQMTLVSLPFWMASIIVGLVAVAYSELFEWIEHFNKSFYLKGNLWIFVATPAALLLSWWTIYRFSDSAGGSGIPQLMTAIRFHGRKKGVADKLLSLRMIIIKIISSALGLIGGATVGREGPTLQISAAIFYRVSKWIPADWPQVSQKLMMISGGAAGLSAAFNTPLGGIVFAIEELGKYHLNKMKAAIFTAVIIAGLTSQMFLGPYLYLGAPSTNTFSWTGVPIIILAAGAAGILGGFFSKIVLFLTQLKQQYVKGFWGNFVFVFLLGLAIAGLIFNYGINATGSGKELMNEYLFHHHRDGDLLAFPVRFSGAIMAFLSGGAGGVFAPSLTIGATIGHFFNEVLNVSDFQNLIILGCMIGFLVGVTHSPFTSFILVLEMSDRHAAVFPMMLAALISYFGTRMVAKRSLYENIVRNYFSKNKNDTRLQTPEPEGE